MWGAVFYTALLIVVWRRQRTGALVGAVMLSVAALTAYLLLPEDWMSEVRFATLFFPGFYLAGSYTLYYLVPRFWYVCLLCFLVVLSAVVSVNRISYFREHPPISIDEVKDRSDKISHWGKLLGLTRPTLLTADIGGALLRDEVGIVDLGMLTDKVIAETLGEGSKHRDVKKFRDYIFDQRKPVFMELRAYHSWITRFGEDPRFRRDYVAIKEYPDTWVHRRYGEDVWSGDFVRRDAVVDKSDLLSQMQCEAASMYYPFCEKIESPGNLICP
jgi:hypothetical protein